MFQSSTLTEQEEVMKNEEQRPSLRYLIVTHCRIPTTRLIRPLPLQPRHLVRTQLEIKDRSILLDACRRHALGQGHKPLLQTPSQQHLGPRLAVSIRDLVQDRVVGPLTPHERTVRLHDDAPGPTPVDDVVARQPGVQLPLADGDCAAGAGTVLGLEGLDVGLELGEVMDAVVGDAEGADLARLLGGDQSVPGAEACGAAAVRGVD